MPAGALLPFGVFPVEELRLHFGTSGPEEDVIECSFSPYDPVSSEHGSRLEESLVAIAWRPARAAGAAPGRNKRDPHDRGGEGDEHWDSHQFHEVLLSGFELATPPPGSGHNCRLVDRAEA